MGVTGFDGIFKGMTYVIVIILLTCSALFSGLNLGLMSLSSYELKRKAKLGNKRAAKVYPIRKTGNLLLVSLLLGNVLVNSILAVFLGSIASGIIAVIGSTALITMFGEILPQAFFSRFALAFGAKTIWFTRTIMFVLYPLTKPIAMGLDKVLGEELPAVYSRKELLEILEEHSESDRSDIQQDEERIASGALTFGRQTVKDVMIPRSAVVSLQASDVLDEKTVNATTKRGYARFPVMSADHSKVEGILYAYNLIGSANSGKTALSASDKKVHFIHEDESLDIALNRFIRLKHHMFVVVNGFSEYTGIVTLEDVLEEIVGKEIVDEFDEYTDVRKVAKSTAKRISAS